MADNTAKILEDTVGVAGYDGQEYRVVQLESWYSSHTIQHHVASLRTCGAIITQLRTNKKPKQHQFTSSEMDALTEQWTQFKADIATLKAAQEAEKLQKFKDTWAEITRLAESVPGLEISTMDSTWTNWDTNEEMPHTQVKLPAIGFHRVHLTLPEKILAWVKEAVEQYARVLKNYEDGEKVGWQRWNVPSHVESGKVFLSTHREWLAQQIAQEATV